MEKSQKKIFGRVKWFNNAKGYGFLETEAQADVFVHYSEIRGEGFKTLQMGQNVAYFCVSTDKGLQAKDVTPIISPECLTTLSAGDRARVVEGLRVAHERDTYHRSGSDIAEAMLRLEATHAVITSTGSSAVTTR